MVCTGWNAEYAARDVMHRHTTARKRDQDHVVGNTNKNVYLFSGRKRQISQANSREYKH
jgi:hypothetical protein